MSMVEITSINHPELQPYRTLRQLSLQPHAFPYTIAEGTRVVERLLHSSIPVTSLLCTPEKYTAYQHLIQAKAIPQDKIFIAPRSLIEQIVGFKYHQGIMALLPAPQPVPLEQLTPPYVLLNGISNTENVGLIIRSARSFGISSLITDATSCSPFLRRVIRVSMGMCFEIQWHRTKDLIATLQQLRHNGISVIAIELHPSAHRLDHTPLPHSAAFIFGSEGDGITPEALQQSNLIVQIPSISTTHSLNVAMAATITFYEYRRHHPLYRA